MTARLFLRSATLALIMTCGLAPADGPLNDVLGGSLTPAPALAQSLGEGGGDDPIEVLADDGIEWRRDLGMYIARGNAKAIQGDSQVFGQVLIAYYRDRDTEDGAAAGEGSGSSASGNIYRMEARGGVQITAPDQIVTGDHAVRDLDRGVTWVTGSNLRMETPSEIVTARDSLEYWDAQRVAVARGNAKAVQPSNGQTLTADTLVAYFKEEGAQTAESGTASGNQSGMKLMTASGNVRVETEKGEIITGDEGTYDPATGEAVLTGNVHVTSGADRLSGSRAVVNMDTGMSRLFSDSGGRARALFTPSRPKNDGEEQGQGQGGSQ